MTETTIHGHTEAGRPITDQDVEILAAETEAGYDVETLTARRNKRGRPTLGNAPASVESVRLDPELRRLLLDRAETESRGEQQPRVADSYRREVFGRHRRCRGHVLIPS